MEKIKIFLIFIKNIISLQIIKQNLRLIDMTNKTKNKVFNFESGLNKDAEIKRLKAVLKEIEDKFDESQVIAHFGFSELNPVTLNQKWSDGLFKIVGYNPGIGDFNHYNDNKRIIHPDDWDYFYKATQTVFNTGEDIEFDVRVIRPDDYRMLSFI